MSYFSTLILSILLPTRLFAATPFVISGSKINAIFSEKSIWKNVSGSVMAIELVSSTKNVSKYKLKTKKCSFTVEVHSSVDALAPRWKVKDVIGLSTKNC